VAGDVAELRERLLAIADELADLALDRLREAVAGDDTVSPVHERRLTRARRAVEKAAALLGEEELDATEA
jgi:hypothetical protein